MRRSKLDKHPNLKREIAEEYANGKTIREIEQNVKVKFPHVNISRSAIHRFLKSIKPFLKLREAGLIDAKDVDLITHSQDLMVIARGLLAQLLADWYEKGEIESEKVQLMLDFVLGVERISRTSAYVQKTKEDIAIKTGRLVEKFAVVLYKHLADNPDLANRIIRDLQNELQD